MPNQIKGLVFNTIGGILSGLIVLYLDEQGLTSYGYVAFALYVCALAAILYYQIQVARLANGKVNPITKNPHNVENGNVKPRKDDILHNILALIAKYHSQEIHATPKRIGVDLGLDPEITLAHMWKYHNEQFIAFRNDGKKPDLDTPFFLGPKAWEYIAIVPA